MSIAKSSPPYRPISEYALIGDCRSAGLISRDGSLDWLCVPRFDSPSIFAALLDAEAGGHVSIRPAGAFVATRRYLPDTNILETTFETPGGVAVLRDLMPVSTEEDKRASMSPQHEVLREIAGLSGEVDLEIVNQPRPSYGRVRPVLRRRGALGLWCEAHGAALVLRSEVPLEVRDDGHSASGVARIRAGERKYLSLAYSEEGPAVVSLLGEDAHRRLDRSVSWWRAWASRCTYDGPYRDAVVRSALALKLMAFAPSGAVIAAPTTSLPEQLGGVRNWDYRFCWLPMPPSRSVRSSPWATTRRPRPS